MGFTLWVTHAGPGLQRSSVGVGGDEEEREVSGKLQLDSVVRKEEESESVTTACSTELEEVTDGGGRDGGVRGVRGVLAVLRHQVTPSTGGLHREGEGVETDQRDTSDELRAAQDGGDSRGRRRTAKAPRVRVSAFCNDKVYPWCH